VSGREALLARKQTPRSNREIYNTGTRPGRRDGDLKKNPKNPPNKEDEERTRKSPYRWEERIKQDQIEIEAGGRWDFLGRDLKRGNWTQDWGGEFQKNRSRRCKNLKISRKRGNKQKVLKNF